MSLITLQAAHLSFGAQPVLDGENLRIGEGERIGLVGANGTGKSTLLRVLLGTQPLDSGQVDRARGCRVGYLPQDIIEVAEGTVLGSVMAAVPERAELQGRIQRAQAWLEEAEDPDEQMKAARMLADATERLDHFDGSYGEHAARRILHGLGFSQEDMERPTAELSGGWKMRAALAGLLFQGPDVLFLDEPTNHLDLPSVLWLDGFLDGYKNTIVLICHDRDFFNRHVERVIAFQPEGLRHYRGNYDNYLEQRTAEEAVLEATARTQERKLKELERFVERNRVRASSARQAQSRVRLIEKMQQELEGPVVRPRQLSFKFPKTERTGRNVLMLENVHKAFGERVLYRGLTRTIFAGDRVGLIGPNGRGKSTLLKMMAAELRPDDGEVRLGAAVKPGYFAQHHTEQLDPRRTVLEEVFRQKPTAGESFIRGVCGAFLFSGDDVEKPIAVLSGGERARVLLARLLVNPGNLLLLDEPTTHLDVAASEAMVEALCSYDGTMVFVSHNIALLNRLPTKIWDIQGGTIEEYPGNLAEYREHLRLREQRQGTRTQQAGSDASPSEDEGRELAGETRKERQERKRREAQRRNELARLTREARRAVEEAEARVEALEAERAAISAQLADPALYQDGERARDAARRHDTLEREAAKIYEVWEKKQQELERITREFEGQESCER